MEWTEFCEKVSRLLEPWKTKLQFDYDDHKITYVIAKQKYEYTIDEYNELKQKAECYDFQRYSICNKNIYESIVDIPDIDSRGHYSTLLGDRITEFTLKDDEKDIEYSFCDISEELIWYLIKDFDVKRRVLPRFPNSFFERRCESLIDKDIFSLIKMLNRLPAAVHIETSSPKSREQLQKFARSYLFNIAYNFDYVFKAVTEIDGLFPQRSILTRRRHQNISELMPPQRFYQEQLVEQYYMALTSEDSFVKFIGFYHIMEYFYEEVYNEDVLKSVQYIIQHPGFSAKRTKDIAKIVDLIKKKNRLNKEGFQGSELEALELTLKKFVNLSELVNDLTEFNDSIVEYYKTTEVNFSKGDAIDLKDVSNEKLYKKLAARIYKTRNSLVHSKSNETRLSERGIYNPFTNSKALAKEIPLMRYISEAIIINSSSSL